MGSEKSSPPWGRWRVIEDASDFKVKCIEVLPEKRLSYQKHFKREEHWYVVNGEAKVTIDGVEHHVCRGGSIDITKEALHRIENVGKDLLIFIEVQTGTYFGEDDIMRIEDDFGRT
jgi:mannose-6-phosphate isomerase